MFIDKFSNSLEILNLSIDKLLDVFLYDEALKELFRVFHNLKASSGFLNGDEFLEIVKRVESVISVLQKSKPPIDKRIFDWVVDVKSQFTLWLEEMEERKDSLSPLQQNLKETITIANSDNKNPKEILRDLTLLYITQKSDNKILTLNESLKDLKLADSIKLAIQRLKSEKIDLIILELNDIGNIEDVNELKSIKSNRPLIIYTTSKSKDFEKRVKLLGVNHYLDSSINEKQLLIEILSLAYTFFCQKSIRITNNRIKEAIKYLPPLPDSIFQIQKICADDDSSVNDLVRVVKKDPVISANLLKVAQSPYFGFSNVNTIDKAVSLFGKSTTKALSFAGMMYKNFDFDLSCYSIDANQYSTVSQLRSRLMVRWYSKVSFHKLVILATSSIIGNLGQLLIAKNLKEKNQMEEFKKLLNEKSVRDAELSMFNVTNQEISSDILSYWNLETLLSDSIRYSQNINYAYDSVKPYAVANRVVFAMIDCLGRIKQEIPAEIKKLMVENELDLVPLENALKILLRES